MTTVKDFVKETLGQISAAIDEHNQEIGGGIRTADIDRGKVVSPFVGPSRGETAGYINTDKGSVATSVSFDIAVTVEESGELGGKAALKVASIFEASGGGEVARTNTNVSRVQFTLPIQLPN